LSTAPHRRRATALRAGQRRHDRASSGHAASDPACAPRPQPAAQVAKALADAFLSSPWQRAALLEAGYAVLGAKRRWLGPVVTALLRAYREAPADRPRELARFVATIEAVRPAIVRTRRAVATRTVRMRWDTPPIDDLAALADFIDLDGDDLDWFADRREINRHARDQRLRHYRYTWLGHRLIEAPKPRMRAMQRRLLDEVLGRLPIHGQVHGFVPGRGVHTFAAIHAGQPVLVRLDLMAFFSTVTASRVYGLFRTAGYPEPVAHALTALTTTRTPADVLRGAPDWHRAALLRRPHLPQGAPTSPALANLCAFRLDRRLAGLATRFGVAYARYADDLAFSGALSQSSARRLVRHVTEIAAGEGFRVHPAKTRIRGQADRQALAGLVVNAHAAVPREEYDRLRAILHNAARDGLEAADRDGHPDFAAYLAGRVAWVSHRHPSRADKLRSLLNAATSEPDLRT
jgi:RNA-directed DNA polymerase